MKTDFMPTVNLLTIELQSKDQTIITLKKFIKKTIFSSKPGLNLFLVCRQPWPVFHDLDQPPYIKITSV